MNTGLNILLRRLPHTIVIVVLVTMLVSLMATIMPGDPAAIAAGEVADPAYVAALRDELGLNESLPARYLGFIGGLFTGDLGTSVSVGRGVPVASMLSDSLAVTMSLLTFAMFVVLLVAIPAGYAAALHRGSWIDRGVTGVSAGLLATPPFVIGVIGVTVFAIDLAWLPALGYKPLGSGLGDWLAHLVIPAVALGAVSAAELARQVRSAFVDTLEMDYVRTAEAKGLRRRGVVWKHALKNAASPIVVVASLQIPRIIGAAVVIETVFALPGFGRLAFQSVERRDLPLMQGVVLVGALIVIVTNLATDVVLAYLNPKGRHDGN